MNVSYFLSSFNCGTGPSTESYLGCFSVLYKLIKEFNINCYTFQLLLLPNRHLFYSLVSLGTVQPLYKITCAGISHDF